MCQKGARAEGRVAVPTGRLCKARFEVKYLPVLGPSGQGRVGTGVADGRPIERPAGSVPPPGAPSSRGGGPPGDGWAARRDPET